MNEYGQGRFLRFCSESSPSEDGVPRDDDAVTRAGVTLQQVDEAGDLVAPEVLAPAVTVGRRHDAVEVGELVPDFGELAQRLVGAAAAGEEPDLLGDEHAHGDTA